MGSFFKTVSLNYNTEEQLTEVNNLKNLIFKYFGFINDIDLN